MPEFVDTDVLVDFKRGMAAAEAWLSSIAGEVPQVPAIVVMELLAGCRSAADLRSTQVFLQTFEVIYPSPAEFEVAIDLLALHRLASGLGISDCLIAAMALEREAVLYSFNRRHFAVVAGLDVREPYQQL